MSHAKMMFASNEMQDRKFLLDRTPNLIKVVTKLRILLVKENDDLKYHYPLAREIACVMPCGYNLLLF